MLWLITDTHIGHRNIIKYCDRPNNCDRMILENWKKLVKSTDTVIHLGDVAWSDEHLQKVLKLPGKKILVKGNHDNKSTFYYMDAGFTLVVSSMLMSLNGMNVLFSHQPIFDHTADINIHGHQHDLHREDMTKLYLPLAIETMGYRPIPVDEEFLSTIRSWRDRSYIPKLEEIIALKQNYIGKPRLCDLVGQIEARWQEATISEDDIAKK